MNPRPHIQHPAARGLLRPRLVYRPAWTKAELQMKKWFSQVTYLKGFEDEAQLALGLLLFIACALLIYRFVHRVFLSLVYSGNLPPHMSRRLTQLFGWSLFLLVVSVVLQRTGAFDQAWDVFSTILLATAVGFIALWSVLSNAVCSVLILVMRPFRFNDNIEIVEPADTKPGIQGRVIDLNLMFTTIEVDDREDALVLCRVPNTMFFTKGVRVTISKPLAHSHSFFGPME